MPESVAAVLVSLGRRAAEVADAELRRLAARRPDLDDRVRDEIADTVRRVTDRLLRPPAVRLSGTDHTHALCALFDLDPAD